MYTYVQDNLNLKNLWTLRHKHEIGKLQIQLKNM